MARPPNREHRRAQIVAAFERVVARDGLAGATMVAVAAEAGLAQGLLHYHFGSKQEMVVALVHHLGALTEARFASYAGAGGPRRRLHAWLDAVATGVPVGLELASEARRDLAVGAAWAALVAARIARTEALVAAIGAAEGRSAPPRIGGLLVAAVIGQAATGAAACHSEMIEALLGPEVAPARERKADDWALWR